MNTINTYGDISPRVGLRASRRFLARLLPETVTQRFGQREVQRTGEGRIAKFRRYESLALTAAPLAEGISPAGQKLRYTDVTLVLEQYGDKIGITDVIADTHEDPILQINTDLCGEQASQSIEVITLNKLKGGSSFLGASGVTTRATVAAAPTAGDFARAVRILDRANAKPITKMVKATPDYGTTPVRAGFVGISHPDMNWDLAAMTGWKPVATYANPGEALPNEEGAIGRVRIITTTNLKPWLSAGSAGQSGKLSGGALNAGLAADVYPILIFGQDWYARANLQGMDAAKIMVLQPNVPRGGDELGQQGWVSWKLYYGIEILNDALGTRLECACTANPT